MPSGLVDASYGVGGKFTASTTTAANGMAVAPDGSVIVTGNAGIFKVDPSGLVVEPLASGLLPSPRTSSAIADPAGNIYFIVGGSGAWFGIFALDPAGRLDSAFGVNGRADLPSLGGAGDVMNDLLRDSEGNLYIVGSRNLGVGGVVAGAKFDRAGRLVTSFGANGIAAIATGAIGAAANSATTDGAGNLYIVGSASDKAFVAKVDRDGRLVPGFGTGGFWRDARCAGTSIGAAVAIDAGGSLYVAGRCDSRPAVFKVDAAGNLVAPFRDAGLRGGLFGSDDSTFTDAAAVLAGPGGTLYVAGAVTRPNVLCRDLAVARLDSNGNPVVSFGENGVTRLGVPNGTLTDMGLDAQGRLYAGGISNACTSATILGYSVFRLGG